MRDSFGRAMTSGLRVAIAIGVIACQPSPGETCGDGWCAPGMQCKAVSTDGPVPQLTCVIPNICGNGIVEDKEECDGPYAGLQPCSPNCRQERCGNHIIDDDNANDIHEVCDDGNTMDGDGCSRDCMSLERCGDGMMDPGEECDGTDGPQPCSASCHQERCGNGILDDDPRTGVHEQCDDGNMSDGDGCSRDCKYEFCGDGKVNNHEVCDPSVDPVHCNLDCTPSVCGDGKINPHANPPEQCDSGTASGVNLNQDDAACTSACQINVCGDGKVLRGVEECDDGAANGTVVSPNHCNQFCHSNRCGNGILEPGEQCDDGTDSMGQNNNHDGARCNAMCQYNVCGDGDTLTDVEQCDDGNTDACGTCPEARCNAPPITAAASMGMIQASLGSQITAGDSFTLADGFGKTLTFEFDTDPQQTTTAVKILFGTADTAAAIAGSIVNAVNGQSGFSIKAGLAERGDTVTLTNLHRSSRGNTAITVNGLASFVFSGGGAPQMDGGKAGDCPNGTGCMSGDDCMSGTCDDVSHTCQ